MDGGLFNETDSEEEEREARQLAAVDTLPGSARYQPEWYTGGLSATARSAPTSYIDELNRERLHRNYLAVMSPVLTPQAEAALWEEAALRRINVTHVKNPSLLELRRNLPKAKKPWYFDDSDDEAEEAKREAEAAAAKTAARLAAATAKEAAQRQGRVQSMLSASQSIWGGDSDSDSDAGNSSASDTEAPRSLLSGNNKASKATPLPAVAVSENDHEDEDEDDDDSQSEARRKRNEEEAKKQKDEFAGLSTKERARLTRQKAAEKKKKAKARAAAAAAAAAEGAAAKALLDDDDDEENGVVVDPVEKWTSALSAYFVAAQKGGIEDVAEALNDLEKAMALWQERNTPSSGTATSTGNGTPASTQAGSGGAQATGPTSRSEGGVGAPQTGKGVGGLMEPLPGLPLTGCCVDVADAKGYTALHWACDRCDDSLCGWLLRRGHATMDLPDKLGLTPLHVASCNGALECCQLLCHHATNSGGKKKNSSNSRSSSGDDNDDLSYHIFRGHGFAMDGYVWKGVSGTQRHQDFEAAAAAEAAGEGGDEEKEDNPEVGSKDNENESGKGSGVDATSGDKKAAGGKDDAPLPCNGTALWWACVYGHLPVVQYLVQTYKPLMDDSQGEETDTPLWAAVFHRRVEVALFLVAEGADATCTNGNGITINQLMKLRGLEQPELIEAVQEAIAQSESRQAARQREEDLVAARKNVSGQGEPDTGPGVGLFLIAIPDKRKSTLKRRIPLECSIKWLFDLVDVHATDKCALDCFYGFELHVTSSGGKVLKRHLLEDHDLLQDLNFTKPRVTMEMVQVQPPEKEPEET